MFEMMIAEKMRSENKEFGEDGEQEPNPRKTAQFKPSRVDRALSVLGQAMITTGLKLKYRQYARLSTEESRAPNFLIML